MKFTPLEEIDFILDSLVKFSNTNEYDFRLFKEYAEEQAKVFNIYFSKTENEDDKQKILSQLDDNFHFLIDDVVTDMLASSYDNGSIIESNIEVAVVPNVTTPDHRVSGFKENYRELIRLFKSKIKTSEKGAEENKDKETYPEKYYALYHWLLIEMGKEKPFEKDSITDRYSKPDIMKFGKGRYKFKTQGQVFYDTYINTDITNKTAIAKSYGKGYKNKLIDISNNDADVISLLKKYPN